MQNNAHWSAGLNGIRYLDMEKLELVKIANMSHPRWYPSATLMPNNKVVIMGGTRVRADRGDAWMHPGIAELLWAACVC